ncbi:ubiquitin carboxyl-terminal hydrolase MINDY-1-like [Impatiens glandulifera]|uniref:ubiquitin carboxyl-terminal hydrolase MINDY-1-like n=1 Tax=Impatiens glandulifera TaxID=253017 RepID=UPI001FB13528|nr:ubiquitin carboxyl-terminal hydrolase MINDY-1-like [Impatiens glandulifera]
MASEEDQRDVFPKEMMYRTKVIKFLGRTTPIILQNENGPCPLLAICNVLLLKNNLTLSPDVAEVSQEKLLSLVAERLIDSNSNVNNKDMGFLENQQQNIADAIDLLPLLATGIDVNTKFRRIDDFEFTRECTIFDLLDIPLYHGWIVDPQDIDTANAIGSKSYNTLMEELVSLETRKQEHENSYEGDSVDFAAATAATLGVPSPSLSRGISFDDSPQCAPDCHTTKGDMDEKPEKLGVLKLSEGELQVPSDDIKDLANGFNGSVCLDTSDTSVLTEELGLVDNENKESQITGDHNAFSNSNDQVISQETTCGEPVSTKTDQENSISVSSSEKTVTCEESKDIVVTDRINNLVQRENMESAGEFPSTSDIEDPASKDEQHILESYRDGHIISNGQNKLEATELSTPVAYADLDSLGDKSQHIELPNVVASSVDNSEPIYEGEERMDSAVTIHQDREPIYEGEVVLAEQVEKSTGDDDDNKGSSMNKITTKQGDLIRNFLDSNASQLTIFGLFFLQEGLKQRELSVFFRNNHFNTMFKFDGQLYILATDQGYINQPDLVWEKLNEVNGNTVFMTGDFKEFRIEDRTGSIWDEQNAVTNTTDYLASIDTSAQDNSSFNSDLQLAIALQQQEFEQQQQPRNVQQPQQTVSTNSSRLITGPQVPRSSARNPQVVPTRPEPKQTKEKCSIM